MHYIYIPLFGLPIGMVKPSAFRSTAEIKVADRIIEQVVGQEDAVEVIRKAAQQRRHVLLIGEPGTGKSMLGLALAELLPKEKLVDTLSFPNPNDENQPLIRTMPAGQGRQLVTKAKLQTMNMFKNQNVLMLALVILAMIAPWWARSYYKSDIMFAAFFLGGMVFLASFVLFLNLGKKMDAKVQVPKLIVDNYQKKQCPFFDATGAHAGALLGDVMHDPFQCYFPVVTLLNEKRERMRLDNKLDQLFEIHRNSTVRKVQRNYEAVYLRKKELVVMGETGGSVSPVEVLSCNRHEHDGTMIKLTTSENKELIVTPDHKVAIWKNDEIVYVEAQNLKGGDGVVAMSEDIIIDEQDIINTYNGWQQEQCRLYYQYRELKAEHPSWGYKRIAKAMGYPYGKTRWWHAGKHIPVPIQTSAWLKGRGLLPLKIGSTKLPLIAKIVGAIFGDGGVFENLNGIFLSSSNYRDVEEFSTDLQRIFGNEAVLNAELREGGEYGHSWCLTNTNRNIIRFFIALGAPKGNKTNTELVIPRWIQFDGIWKDEFYGSLFGSELGVSLRREHPPRIEFAITGLAHLGKNRIDFLTEVITYLESKGVEVTKREIDIREVKTKQGRNGNMIYRFIVSQSSYNIENFVENVKINYCNLKKWKLITIMDRDKKDKLVKYLDLRARGLGAEAIMKKLEIDQKYLYKILNSTKISVQELGAAS